MFLYKRGVDVREKGFLGVLFFVTRTKANDIRGLIMCGQLMGCLKLFIH